MPDYPLAIRRAARRYGVRPELLVAQLTQESGLNPDAVSPAGARGIAQFMPGTAKGYGVNLHDNRARDDIDGAARHMRDLLRKYGGDERKALAAYNAGAGAVDKYGGVPPYKETQNYVSRVLSNAKGRPAGEPEVPGTDAPPARRREVDPEAKRSLLLGYLEERGRPDALLSLARGLSDAQVERETPRTYGRAPRAKAPSGLGDAVRLVDEFAGKYGAPITAKQEPGHAVGGDHDPEVKGATARDIGGGEEERRRIFREITRALGVRGSYGAADINVVKNGVRWQIISRPHGSGPHLHVGLRKV